MLFYFLKAWLIGLAIAAPIGLIGMLCITRALAFGLTGAILVGFGAALADACYGAIAALGLSTMISLLSQQIVVIKAVGGVFLLYLAYREIRHAKITKKVSTIYAKKLQIVCEAFLLTLINPMTILSFVAIFASISSGPVSLFELLAMIAGIFFGSMTWWFILGGIVVKICHKIPSVWLERIHYFSSIVLGSFGAFSLLNLL